jgi:predicted nuclease of predicted toxin-antitoxin system
LKLLIDEMYPPSIAEQLRDRGQDVQAVTEHPELRSLADTDIFALAQQQQRAVVTENVADFSIIASGYDQRGQAHHGLILVARGSYPRGRRGTIGRMVTELERLLEEHPDVGPTGLRYWL